MSFQKLRGLINNFALGIVRVQYRFFIGTGAKRSPEKPDPCAAWGTPKSVNGWPFTISLYRFNLIRPLKTYVF
jgi:hypothetical protein